MTKKFWYIFLGVSILIPFCVHGAAPAASLKGRILLQVESKGEAWYVDPLTGQRYILGSPADALKLLASKGLGMSSDNLKKIPVATEIVSGLDSDKDGLPDDLENAIGSNKNSPDSDADGYNDITEIKNGYNPVGSGKIKTDAAFAKKFFGRILLQVQSKGEAWYVSPSNGKRYFLNQPNDALNIIKRLGLGISNNNLKKIPVKTISQPSQPAPTQGPDKVVTIIKPGDEPLPKEAPAVETASRSWGMMQTIYESGRQTPNLFFSSNGDLWLFSADSGNLLSEKKRPVGGSFGQDITIAQGCREASPLFVGNEIRSLAVSGEKNIYIYKTGNDGQSWDREESYSSSDSQFDGGYFKSVLAGDENQAVLAFGFNHDSGVFGAASQIMVARRQNGVWGKTPENLGSGEPLGVSLSENTTTVISGNGVFANSGGSWIKKINPGDVYEDVRASGYFQNGSTIYLARDYSYGPEPNNKNIGFYNSSDNGLTWSSLKKIHVQSDIIRSVAIGASGETILVAWYSYATRQKIQGRFSFDGGKTWGEEFTVLELPEGEKVPDNETGRNTQIKLAGWSGGLALAVITESGKIYLKEYK